MQNKKLIPLYKIVPNIVTIIGILLGLTSIKHMLYGRWEMASILICLAGVFDGIDGRVARILGAESYFGAQLDSLADLCNFGIVPALLMYLWKLNEIKIFGWMVTMLYVVSIVIRLARFNVSIYSDDKIIAQLNKNFFFGIPSPIAALLFILPLLISQDDFWFSLNFLIESNSFYILYGFIISFLVVSKVATFSTKNIKVPHYMITFIQCFIGVYIIFIFVKPWFLIPISCFLFLLSIPVSHFIFLSYKNKLENLSK